MVTTVLSTPRISFMNYRDAEGSTWLIVDMRSYAPASIALTPTTFQISTRGTDQSEAVVRGDVATTTLVHMACALVKLGDEPLEVTASYAGDARHAATTSWPYMYKANADPRRYTYYDQCERTDLTESAPAARASVVDTAAESAAAPAAADTTDANPVTVAWVAPSDTIAAGTPVSLAVDVDHEGSALDDGVVDFIVDGDVVGSAAPVDGRFTLELAPLSSGPHVIDAVYSDPADETDEASHPGAAAEQRTVTVSPEPVELALEVDGLEQAVPGGPVTVRATASATATDEDVEGQVVFFDDDLFLGVAPLTDGIAALEGTALNEESNTVRAWLQTDSQRWAGPGEVSVPAAYPIVATSLSLSVDDVSIADSEGDVLVELVGGSEAHPATGSVALYDGDSELLALSSADEVPARDGVTTAWSVPVSSLAVGSLDLSAVFTGDPGVASAQSAATVVELAARPTAVSARVADSTLIVTATADTTALTEEARGAKPWGVIAVHRGSDVLGYATVVDGTATVDLPDSVSASSLRIEFLPVSADLSSSETTVRVGALARTGTSAPDALLAVALLTLAGVALIAFGRRRVTS
nr:Ig-like domain-containing protein [Agromyces atrinae]